MSEYFLALERKEGKPDLTEIKRKQDDESESNILLRLWSCSRFAGES